MLCEWSLRTSMLTAANLTSESSVLRANQRKARTAGQSKRRSLPQPNQSERILRNLANRQASEKKPEAKDKNAANRRHRRAGAAYLLSWPTWAHGITRCVIETLTSRPQVSTIRCRVKLTGENFAGRDSRLSAARPGCVFKCPMRFNPFPVASAPNVPDTRRKNNAEKRHTLLYNAMVAYRSHLNSRKNNGLNRNTHNRRSTRCHTG